MKRYVDESKVAGTTKQAMEILAGLHFNPRNKRPIKVMENYLKASMSEVTSRLNPQATKLMIMGFMDHIDWAEVDSYMLGLQEQRDVEAKQSEFRNRTDKERIRNAFKALRKQGYFARMNFLCCQGCAWSAIGQLKEEGKLEDTDNVVFYHNQDNDAYDSDKNFETLMIRWAGNPTVITQALLDQGLDVSWSGSEHNTIVARHAKDPIDPKFSEDDKSCMAKGTKLSKKAQTVLDKMLCMTRGEKVQIKS